jgi:rhomboid protease GluP
MHNNLDPAQPFSTHTRSWTFLSSWRSTSAAVLALLAVFELIFIVAAASMRANGKPGAWTFIILAMVVIWMMVRSGRLLFSKKPFLQFDSHGISGKALRRKTIAWQDVANLSLLSSRLRIEFKPRAGRRTKRGWFGKAAPQRLIPLTVVPTADRPGILHAAHEAFLLYSPLAATAAVEANRAEIQVLAAFEARLQELTPRVWAMPVVIAACVLVWIANVASGMSAFAPDSADLYRWGGNATSAVQAGQWWRLVTAMFLHGGVAHLAFNMFALWEAGKLVSRLFGNRGFLLIYFGSGIAGGALSMHFAAQTHVAVGASGAIFGVAGALLAAVLQHRGQFPPARSKQLLTGLGIFIAYSLLNGFAKQGIDNAAHVGGLGAGLVIGWLLIEKLDNTASMRKRFSHFLLAGMLCVFGGGGLAAAAAPAKRDIGRYFLDLRTWQSLQPEISRLGSAIQQDGTDVKNGKMSEYVLLQRMETDYLPTLHSVVARLTALRFADEGMPDHYIRLQQHQLSTLEALLDAQVTYNKSPSPELEQSITRLSGEMQKTKAEIDKVSTELAQKKRS